MELMLAKKTISCLDPPACSPAATAYGHRSGNKSVAIHPLVHLWDAWMKGPQARRLLMATGLNLGFSVIDIRNERENVVHRFHDYTHHAPCSEYLNFWYLYNHGLKENVDQHAGGNGIFMWRETYQGYEFLMFDHGTGVIGPRCLPVADLSRIFDKGMSIRKPVWDSTIQDYVSGAGIGAFHYASKAHFLRLISVSDGALRVVDKISPYASSGNKFQTRQTDYALSDIGVHYQDTHGIVVHGMVLLEPHFYQKLYSLLGREMTFSGPSKDDVIGIMSEDTHWNSHVRGPWQKPVLSELKFIQPGDHVGVNYIRTRLVKKGETDLQTLYRLYHHVTYILQESPHQRTVRLDEKDLEYLGLTGIRQPIRVIAARLDKVRERLGITIDELAGFGKDGCLPSDLSEEYWLNEETYIVGRVAATPLNGGNGMYIIRRKHGNISTVPAQAIDSIEVFERK